MSNNAEAKKKDATNDHLSANRLKSLGDKGDGES